MNDILALCIMESEGFFNSRQEKIGNAIKSATSFQEATYLCSRLGISTLTNSEKNQIKRALLSN